MADIEVIDAWEHNLQGLTVRLPRNRLIAVTGPSGSGKSSLVFDVLFAEAQRAYLESLSTYARASLPRLTPARVAEVRGLSPAVLIDQQPLGRNPRSTVGTVTEIYTYLRLLFSRLGEPELSAGDFSFNTPAGACPACTGLGEELTPDLDRLLDRQRSLADGAIRHRAWRVGSRYWNILQATGLFDMAKPVRRFRADELQTLLYAEPRTCTNQAPGFVQRFSFEGIVRRLQVRQKDGRGQAGRAYDQEFFNLQPCTACAGSRLNERARAVRVRGRGLAELLTLEAAELTTWLESLPGPVAAAIVPAMHKMLGHLVEVGIGYLALNRSIATLSGGEAQRVKLARQFGSPLTEMIYVLDEPTAGLHPRNVEQLCRQLRGLADKPSTVIVVEHDAQVIRAADHVVELGPGAGSAGGRLVAQGSPADIAGAGTPTGLLLAGASVPVRPRRPLAADFLVLEDLRLHNLQGITVRIPRPALTCLSGPSGSGKSSVLATLLQRQPEVVPVDQSAVGHSPRANPATYTDAFTGIRREFAQATGQNPSLFTFNGAGACTACEGTGHRSIDMHFLGDVRQVCEECGGQRYNPSALAHRYRDRTIADVLALTVTEAQAFLRDADVRRKLGLLIDVGLGYLRLGQPLDTLSGGEAQRVKLAGRLGQRGQFYALDEPTRGLHAVDVERLLAVLHRLVDAGNTVLVIEHNLDVIKNADWVIDLGPGGGRAGGRVVVEGPPEVVAACSASGTARYLADALRGNGSHGKGRTRGATGAQRP